MTPHGQTPDDTTPDDRSERRRGRFALVGGGVLGGVVGAIAAVNFVIAIGPDAGYESSIGDVFADNPLVGMITVMTLVAGPVVGVVVAAHLGRRARR